MPEVVNIPVPEDKSSELTTHEQEMISKAEGKPPENQGTPTLLAGKYKTEAELEKGTLEILTKLYGSKEAGYKALESLIGKPKEEGKAPLPTIPEPAKPNEKPLEIKTADDALKAVGLKFEDFSKEYLEKGKLSEESYQKLAAKGYSKELIDGWIEGQKARETLRKAEAEQVVNEVYAVVGGKEHYEIMTQWASQNLSEAEIKVLNEGLLGDRIHAKLAAEILKQKYVAVNGKNPLLYMGSTPSNASDVFRSKQEMVAAMKDPRYNKDTAYTNDVILKIGRSNIFG